MNENSPPAILQAVDTENGEKESESCVASGNLSVGGISKTTSSLDVAESQHARREMPGCAKLIEVSLENITYAPAARSGSAGGSGKSRRAVLSDVSTKISPYQLSGWMGPSGCGKTSLISVAAGLAGDPAQELAGRSCIRINGEAGEVPKRLVGVVWQEDLLLSNLTVRETVRFAARLKTPRSQADDEVERLVDETIEQLGLRHVQDSLVGDPRAGARGISGGERKRVAVAVELVARPSVLLLDEPTSGLDATTAFQLVLTLKALASLGHAIAVVVHQPRTAIFDMFDNLLLMSKGKVVYEGAPPGARQFLESCPHVPALPPETGKADWIMDVIFEDERRHGGGVLASSWAQFSSKTEQRQSLSLHGGQVEQQPGRSLHRHLSTLSELEEEPKFQVTFWTQLRLLTLRSSRQQRGERITRVATFLTLCWIAFTSLAWGRLPDTTEYVFNKASLFFFLIIAQSNSVVVSSITAFSSERVLLSRERAKKLYGVLPYFIAKTLSDMVNTVALPVFYGAAVYWLCNLRPSASAYFTFILILYLSISTAQSTGLFLSAAIPNISISLMLAPLITLCLMILGGFYIPYDSIHPALRWASWLSMARYGFSAFIINEFDGRFVQCDGDAAATLAIGEECPVPGSSIISSFRVEGTWANVWVNVAMLGGMQIILRVLTYFLLLRSK